MQLSALISQIDMEFEEGIYVIPGCHMEFAERFMIVGELFSGFITSSTKDIFQGTYNPFAL